MSDDNKYMVKYSVDIKGCHSNIQWGIFLKFGHDIAHLMTIGSCEKMFYIDKKIWSIAKGILYADNW